jgi:hypothetical protein
MNDFMNTNEAFTPPDLPIVITTALGLTKVL